jgi:anti-anti-sigma regulatory factor
LKIVAEFRDGTTFIGVTSSLYNQEECDLLIATVQLRLGNGETKFILEMSGCSTISSYGLGQLLKVNSLIKSKGGSCTLRSVPKPVRDILTSLFLDQIITLE